MSYSIIYDRRGIKLGEDKYLMLINSGDNNCWEDNRTPAKSWSALSLNKTVILSENDIDSVIDKYNETYMAKARSNFFETGELRKWLKAGIKNAITIEEALTWDSYTNNIYTYIYASRDSKEFKTTEELLEAIIDLEKENIEFNISFRGRDFTPKKKVLNSTIKPLKNKNCKYAICTEKNEYVISFQKNGHSYRKKPVGDILKFDTLEEVNQFIIDNEVNTRRFFVKQIELRNVLYLLKDKYGCFFTKLTSRHLRYAYDEDSGKLFKTEKEALKSLEKLNNSSSFKSREFEVIKIEKEMFFPA